MRNICLLILFGVETRDRGVSADRTRDPGTWDVGPPPHDHVAGHPRHRHPYGPHRDPAGSGSKEV
ncbi:hypothetical protein Ae263Ps1_0536 [Pseudonocardia sp. Ae263_Ps1]|nr:hypothetical protein Ae263Ps1_0536 [Pseudonocardia sp. Ae263_Ps1]